jgi:hypothetical protein
VTIAFGETPTGTKAPDGVRVPVLAHVVSGPPATRSPARLGAGVVSGAPTGDITHTHPRDTPDVESLYFIPHSERGGSITAGNPLNLSDSPVEVAVSTVSDERSEGFRIGELGRDGEDPRMLEKDGVI